MPPAPTNGPPVSARDGSVAAVRTPRYASAPRTSGLRSRSEALPAAQLDAYDLVPAPEVAAPRADGASGRTGDGSEGRPFGAHPRVAARRAADAHEFVSHKHHVDVDPVDALATLDEWSTGAVGELGAAGAAPLRVGRSGRGDSPDPVTPALALVTLITGAHLLTARPRLFGRRDRPGADRGSGGISASGPRRRVG